mgnify:FL=1|jgi:hypothetical protein
MSQLCVHVKNFKCKNKPRQLQALVVTRQSHSLTDFNLLMSKFSPKRTRHIPQLRIGPEPQPLYRLTSKKPAYHDGDRTFDNAATTGSS